MIVEIAIGVFVGLTLFFYGGQIINSTFDLLFSVIKIFVGPDSYIFKSISFCLKAVWKLQFWFVIVANIITYFVSPEIFPILATATLFYLPYYLQKKSESNRLINDTFFFVRHILLLIFFLFFQIAILMGAMLALMSNIDKESQKGLSWLIIGVLGVYSIGFIVLYFLNVLNVIDTKKWISDKFKNKSDPGSNDEK